MKYELSKDAKSLKMNGNEYKAIGNFETEFSFKANKILQSEILTKDFVTAISKQKPNDNEIFVKYSDNLIGVLALIYNTENEILTNDSFEKRKEEFEQLPISAINKMMGVVNDFFIGSAK